MNPPTGQGTEMHEPTESQRELFHDLAMWAVRASGARPEWRALHLELRPIRDEVRVRLTVDRDDGSRSRTTRLRPDEDAYQQARRLQASYARHGLGSWLTATITVTAEGWPEPRYRVTATINNDAEPAPWSPGESPLDAADLVQMLTRYPRRPTAVPAWVHQRVAAAGLVLPAVPDAPVPAEEDSTAKSPPEGAPGAEAASPGTGTTTSQTAPPPQEHPPTTGVDAAIGSGTGATETTAPGEGTEHTVEHTTETASGTPRTPLPDDALGDDALPDALAVTVGHDGPDPAAEPRRLRLGISLGLGEVLEMIGVPVLFTDDRGTWAVRHGDSGDTGTVLAVVEQGAGTSAGQLPPTTVHLLSEARPVDLLDADGTLALYYCSVPGTVADVLAGAREGVTTPPRRPLAPSENEVLRRALEAYTADPGPTTRLDVLRQSLGGMLMLDASGTTPPEPGSPITNLTLPTLQGPEGMRAIGAFTSNGSLATFRRDLRERTPQEKRDPDEKIIGFWQPAAAVLAFAHRGENVTHLLLDPPRPSYALSPQELKLALAAPSSQRLKDLSLRDHDLQEVYDALRAPNAHLFVATRADEDDKRVPVTAGQGEEEMLLAFTSPAEIAAHDASLRVAQLPALAVLRHLLSRPLAALRINPSGPSLTLSRTQVWHFLGRPRP